MQLAGIAIVGAFVFLSSLAVFAAIKYKIGMRVSDEEADARLDISDHGTYVQPQQTNSKEQLNMKKIEAFIRYEAFDPIRRALAEQGVPSMSVTEVKGSGRQGGITEHYRGAELVIHLRPKIKIECVVGDHEVESVIDAILENGRTGEVGDGKIFVIPVEDAIRVRTGERGDVVMETHPSE